jgi:hypothetical protein
LEDDFGLLCELDDEEDICSISLVFLDLHGRKLEKLTTVEYPTIDSAIAFIVNKIDPTEFLVYFDRRGHTVQMFKVKKTSIHSGKVIYLDFYPEHLYDGQIYGLEWMDDTNASLLFTCFSNCLNI